MFKSNKKINKSLLGTAVNAGSPSYEPCRFFINVNIPSIPSGDDELYLENFQTLNYRGFFNFIRNVGIYFSEEPWFDRLLDWYSSNEPSILVCERDERDIFISIV